MAGSYNPPLSIGVGDFYSDAQNTLEESTRKYVNDQIIDTDFAEDKLSGENIAKGRFNAISNSHTFESGDQAALQELERPNTWSYQTSTTKNNSQTASIQYQDVTNSGVTVSTAGGIAVITAYAYYRVQPNPTVHVATNGGPGNGRWWNQIVLKHVNHQTGDEGVKTTETRNYCFNGTGGVTDTLDPGYDATLSYKRPVLISFQILLGAGDHSFTLSVNPHNELGFALSRSMTVEVFDL